MLQFFENIAYSSPSFCLAFLQGMSYGAIYSRDKSRYVDYQSTLKYREDYRPNEPINFNGSFIHRHTGKERASFEEGLLEETKKNFLLLDHVFDKVHTFL